jgi:nucleoside-diphosphate-sugar epimerase
MFQLEKPKTVIYNLASNHLDEIRRWRLPYDKAIKTLHLWLDLSILHGVEKFIIISNPKVLYKKLTLEEQEYLNACESAVVNYANKFSLYVLKPCNVFGPRQNMASLVPELCSKALDGALDLGSLSKEPQDWMYIKDLFFNIMEILEGKYSSGAFYMRNGEWMSPLTIGELAQGIVSGSEAPRSLRSEEYHIVNEELIEHQYLIWEPQYKLIGALEHTFCWYDANRWAWR